MSVEPAPVTVDGFNVELEMIRAKGISYINRSTLPAIIGLANAVGVTHSPAMSVDELAKILISGVEVAFGIHDELRPKESSPKPANSDSELSIRLLYGLTPSTRNASKGDRVRKAADALGKSAYAYRATNFTPDRMLMAEALFALYQKYTIKAGSSGQASEEVNELLPASPSTSDLVEGGVIAAARSEAAENDPFGLDEDDDPDPLGNEVIEEMYWLYLERYGDSHAYDFDPPNYISMLADACQRPGIVNFWGDAGVGKTHAVGELGSQVASHYVDLRVAKSLTAQLEAILDSLGLATSPGGSGRTVASNFSQLFARHARGSVLIVDHVDSVDQIRELVSGPPLCPVILVTRFPLEFSRIEVSSEIEHYGLSDQRITEIVRRGSDSRTRVDDYFVPVCQGNVGVALSLMQYLRLGGSSGPEVERDWVHSLVATSERVKMLTGVAMPIVAQYSEMLERVREDARALTLLNLVLWGHRYVVESDAYALCLWQRMDVPWNSVEDFKFARARLTSMGVLQARGSRPHNQQAMRPTSRLGIRILRSMLADHAEPSLLALHDADRYLVSDQVSVEHDWRRWEIFRCSLVQLSERILPSMIEGRFSKNPCLTVDCSAICLIVTDTASGARRSIRIEILGDSYVTVYQAELGEWREATGPLARRLAQLIGVLVKGASQLAYIDYQNPRFGEPDETRMGKESDFEETLRSCQMALVSFPKVRLDDVTATAFSPV